ncbi:MAG TPA: FAD/NAD(P)-binding protein [Pedobacter sp.]|nr:FAD/NAD(P)-binding protein [Pedobacter sp.]
MNFTPEKKRIAILGGGPSGLFMYKRLTESNIIGLEIEIFERKAYLGSGMPYSLEGANDEHITNVSDNEIPLIYTSIEEWVKTVPKAFLQRFNINPARFNEYKVLPRLFFGEYLLAQFDLLQQRAATEDISTVIHLNSIITDITDHPESNRVEVNIEGREALFFDCVIICTGHNWPKKHEGVVPGYFDTPYPPRKLALPLNSPVGIKGSSLTAIDAIRTLARANGSFEEITDGKLRFKTDNKSSGFKMVMHSRNGLLPAIRFHLEDSHLGKDALLSPEDIRKNIAQNDGFLSLDFVFEKNFKNMFPEKEPAFYELIRDMNLETFVDKMMSFRENAEPFELFRAEYVEAEQSIRRKQSIYWKEMLAVLSFAMNYPAKYLSAEDMQRLQMVLMPLISIVIAFVPQSSCRELLALHDAGVLEIISVGEDSSVTPDNSGGGTYHYVDEFGKAVSAHFDVFIDCIGQPHLSYEDFPFKGLTTAGTVSQALLRFQSAERGKKEMDAQNELVIRNGEGAYFLKVPGITINDAFQVVDAGGNVNERIHIMAVPYIGGYNPDYSGLDFCEAASEMVIGKLADTMSNDRL